MIIKIIIISVLLTIVNVLFYYFIPPELKKEGMNFSYYVNIQSLANWLILFLFIRFFKKDLNKDNLDNKNEQQKRWLKEVKDGEKNYSRMREETYEGSFSIDKNNSLDGAMSEEDKKNGSISIHKKK